MAGRVRILVVGLGNMGTSHALAYHRLDGFDIAGLMSPRLKTRNDLPPELAGYPRFEDFDEAMAALKPDAVSINSYPDTHAHYAITAMAQGCHVFLEKPLAPTLAQAEEVIAAARASRRKLVLGYILRVHPAWQELIRQGRKLGKPLVMRMNLNQQSSGPAWETHKNLMQSLTPIVDCGVHYVDVMCQLTQSKPIRVHGIGARLSDETVMQNYGHLHVVFEDGSVGWYEAGWGPMMSEEAYFVKDVWGPKGAVTIAYKPSGQADRVSDSASVDQHTKTSALRLHSAARLPDGHFSTPDAWIDTSDEPDHQALCEAEQAWFLRTIQDDIDLSASMNDALESLRIVLAAQESIETGRAIDL